MILAECVDLHRIKVSQTIFLKRHIAAASPKTVYSRMVS